MLILFKIIYTLKKQSCTVYSNKAAGRRQEQVRWIRRSLDANHGEAEAKRKRNPTISLESTHYSSNRMKFMQEYTTFPSHGFSQHFHQAALVRIPGAGTITSILWKDPDSFGLRFRKGFQHLSQVTGSKAQREPTLQGTRCHFPPLASHRD